LSSEVLIYYTKLYGRIVKLLYFITFLAEFTVLAILIVQISDYLLANPYPAIQNLSPIVSDPIMQSIVSSIMWLSIISRALIALEI
jgi:hypothetical protein